MSKSQGRGRGSAWLPRFAGAVRFAGALRSAGAAAAVLAVGLLAMTPPAAARARHQPAAARAAAIYESIVLDARTGQVLTETNADVLTYPASLTKMMTLYLTFEALNAGRLRVDHYFAVSPEAAAKRPSKLGLSAGETVQVQDLILGVVTKSANDAAAVLAEGLAGSEAAFAERMTLKARQLGMTHTTYRNASGLHDPEQRTTARDVARLALALYYHFPREYRYFATQEFEFRGEPFGTHNHMLEWYDGLDGIKTGFINQSGFNIAVSAVRDGRRLIGVMMGGRSARSRDQEVAGLLDQGFATLAAPGAAPRHDGPAVAVAAPARPTPVPQAPVAPAAAPPPRPAAAEATVAERTPPREAPDRIGKLAAAAMHHLSPVRRAEAAPSPREAHAAPEGWGIQVGAFRGESAAERAASHAATLPAAKGKPQHIVPPLKGDRNRLYRARLSHFTQKGAEAACVALRKKLMPCTVVNPSTMRVAGR